MKAIGRKWSDDFKNESLEDGNRFQKPIKRRKVKNFSSDAAALKVKTKDKKVQQVQATRDLGRMLYLSLTFDLDIEHILQFPLTPVPLTLSDIAGAKHTSSKAALKNHLDSQKYRDAPDTFDAVIIDAMCFIHSLPNIPSTYGGLAKQILSSMCKLADIVHFVCDTYKSPSIKDVERHTRYHGQGTSIRVSGPAQTITGFKDCLSDNGFKASLLSFLAAEWRKDTYAEILVDHQVNVGVDSKGFLYTSNGVNVSCQEIEELCCQHEEADTRVILHLSHAIRLHSSEQEEHEEVGNLNRKLSVSLRATDSDIFILLLHHINNMQVKVWMDIGQDENNTREYVNMNKVAKKVGPKICEALPGYHAFTGCDFTASFTTKGKVRPYKKMIQLPYAVEAFAQLGENINVSQSTQAALEKFVCTMYNAPKQATTVNKARLDLFTRNLPHPKQIYHLMISRN